MYINYVHVFCVQEPLACHIGGRCQLQKDRDLTPPPVIFRLPKIITGERERERERDSEKLLLGPQLWMCQKDDKKN